MCVNMVKFYTSDLLKTIIVNKQIDDGYHRGYFTHDVAFDVQNILAHSIFANLDDCHNLIVGLIANELIIND